MNEVPSCLFTTFLDKAQLWQSHVQSDLAFHVTLGAWCTHCPLLITVLPFITVTQKHFSKCKSAWISCKNALSVNTQQFSDLKK